LLGKLVNDDFLDRRLAARPSLRSDDVRSNGRDINRCMFRAQFNLPSQ